MQTQIDIVLVKRGSRNRKLEKYLLQNSEHIYNLLLIQFI